MSRIRKFKVDTASNYGILAIKLLLSLIVFPIYLKVYGERLFGIYLLSVGLAGSFSFFARRRCRADSPI